MMTRYLSYETKSINIISCYIHYREILRQELFLGMITLCLENGIRQKLKSLESNIEKQEEYMENLLENKLAVRRMGKRHFLRNRRWEILTEICFFSMWKK